MEGAQDRKGRMAEESEKEVGLESRWEGREVIEERGESKEGSEC